jgi:hypothetical protein
MGVGCDSFMDIPNVVIILSLAHSHKSANTDFNVLLSGQTKQEVTNDVFDGQQSIQQIVDCYL